ncbi:MAG: DUF5305 domain-containing protein [Halobacteriota archaeon]
MRKLIGEWFSLIVAAVIVIGLIAGGIGYYTHANPPVESEQRTLATWEESTSLTHQATVQRANPVFARGETLADREVYFTQLSPEFEGAHRYVFQANESERVDVELDAVLRFRSVGSSGQTHWEHTKPLNESRYEALAPGETATVSATVNTTEAAAELDRIRSEIGSNTGSAEVAIVYTTRVTGSIDGEEVNETHTAQLDLDHDGSTYSIEPSGAVQESHETTTEIETVGSHGPIRSYGPFVVMLGAFLGSVGMWSYKRRGDLPPSADELAALEQYRRRAEFSDWISRARVPAEALEGTRMQVNSLEDLVDIAIDSNQRVIEDRSRELYFVSGETFYYTYTFETSPEEDSESPVQAELQPSETVSNNGESHGGSNPEAEAMNGDQLGEPDQSA